MIEDATELAFDRSGGYEWCEEPITWSKRHRWLTLTVARYAQQANELDCLLAMWIGMMDTAALKSAERSWRRDQDGFLDSFLEWATSYDDGSPETVEAVVVFGQLWDDVDASSDRPAGGAETDEWDGKPGKSRGEPATPTTCAKQLA